MLDQAHKLPVMRAGLGKRFGERNRALCPGCRSDDVEEYEESLSLALRHCRRCSLEWIERDVLDLDTTARVALTVCRRCNGLGKVRTRVPRYSDAEASDIRTRWPDARPSMIDLMLYDEREDLCPTCEGSRLVVAYQRWNMKQEANNG